MEDKKSFGEYIYKRRLQLGLTQKQFAEKLFITESAVSKWERGLSYPDITLVGEICKILSVSEHELLTASEDVEARNKEKLAQKYILLMNRFKNMLYFIYASSLVTCFICNIAIQHKLSWFFIVLFSEMVAISLTLVPILLPERKGIYTLCSATVSLILLIMVCSMYSGGNWFLITFVSIIFGITLIFLPYILNNVYLTDFLRNRKAIVYFITETILLYIILFVCNDFTGGRWFFLIAVPITTFSLMLPWGMMLIIRYLKINKYHKTAACIGLTSIFVFCVQGFISLILKDELYGFGFKFNFLDWGTDYLNGNIGMIIFIILISLSVVFTMLGSCSHFKKGKKVTVIIFTIILVMSNSTQVFASSSLERFDKLNDYLGSSLEKANIPGASIAIVDKDSVLYQNTYGNCKSINDLFIIGSMSKSFTAMAIMQLVEEDKIDLDSPISKYLPRASYGNEVTIKQLLNHTSGIDVYATVGNYKITSKKGTHVYANANYGLLGKIVERVSGCSYADYISKNIFTKAGMNHSDTSFDKAKENGMIGGYRNYFGLTIEEQMPYPASDSKGWLTVPAGYIISSSADMGRYLQVYLNDGKDMISKKSIHSMFYDNNVKVIEDVYYGMGWGSFSNYREPVIYHGGLVENYSSVMFLLPESGVGICLLTNSNDYLVANNIMSQVYLGILSIVMGEEPNELEGNLYTMKHLGINGIYLVVVILSLLPLLYLKRWNKRWNNSKTFGWIVGFIGIHIIVPTGILISTWISGIPIDVVKGFVPDLFVVLSISVVLFYGTGIIKLFLIVRYFLRSEKCSVRKHDLRVESSSIDK